LPDQIERDTLVQSTRFGDGRVLAVADDLVIVKFVHGIEQVLRGEITPLPSVDYARAAGTLGDPLDAVVRLQALAIRSTNDRWGVFSRSRVQLLPHQLWVCKRVREIWPFRFLVADDVGLGKTIEAGLVITPLVASGVVRRLLVLTPANLAEQWQRRLKEMFDIRLSRYASEIDDARGDFWAANQMVVASFHTLRDDRRGQRERLLQADAWDLVIVDEAHHLNADPRSGPTLAYALVEELERRQRINALLFFTGTPHRGKDFGFLSLTRLVRPDLFDPGQPAGRQLAKLRDAMIRNNKGSATDLEGRKLFTLVTVQTREYGYSSTEDLFYRTMSEFVLEGRAYAASLTGREQTARMLLLVALQKLAASSIAAISAALRRRREMLRRKLAEGRLAAKSAVLADPDPDTDEAAAAEEARPGDVALLLLEDEMQRLDELLSLADAVTSETKIERLLDLVAHEIPSGESLLLFTEYKATQALVINALNRRWGWGCATFINGDERLDGVLDELGLPRTIPCRRESAAEAFNSGQVRFLVSTEAAGEGIDLQEHCATLVHVDLPWNPDAAAPTCRASIPLRADARCRRLYAAKPRHRRSADLESTQPKAIAGTGSVGVRDGRTGGCASASPGDEQPQYLYGCIFGRAWEAAGYALRMVR
jgi:SNF2-related domain/Helicase conserved C-terminal domain